MKKSTGKGILGFPDGSKYVGKLRYGVPHGHGVYTFGKRSNSPGEKYEGEFRDGIFEGHGFLWIPKRGWYKGDFWDGLMHGHGTYWFPTGKKYVGEFVKGAATGVGVEYSENWTLMRGGIWRNWKLLGAPKPVLGGLTKKVHRILGENPYYAGPSANGDEDSV
jgi:hypothetical protein